MARNYAPVPHEYLEEMGDLSDAEFGRLMRALLVYSMTGETVALCGNERFMYRRVTMQEDRFQGSYKETSDGKSEAGKKGAAARWLNGKNGTAINANSKNGTAILPMADDGKNGYTKTKTNTNTKTNTLPTTVGESNKTDKPSFVELDNSTAPEKPREEVPYVEIVSYLNEKAGTEYRAGTQKTRTCIHARWEEGFRLDDFKAVIAKKCATWKGTDMGKYLRPETLFGTKFEGYLNEPNAPSDKPCGRGLDSDELAAIKRMMASEG